MVKGLTDVWGLLVPMKDVKFDFPTPYEDTSIAGDKLWDALMPSKLTLYVEAGGPG